MNATPITWLGWSLLAAGTVFAISKIFEDSSTSLKAEPLLDPNGPEVQFLLVTRNHSQILTPDLLFDLNSTTFKWDFPTKIITHGFMSSINNNVFTLISDAYLDAGNYNIVGMDWSALCHTDYVSAMRGAKIAGQQLADFLNWLSYKSVSLTNVHLIGHSLGAHVAGIAGNLVEGRIGRITGLDPAGPGYENIKEDMKLDPQDAKLVEVIHTFMRVIGTSRPSGHVDFFPNGGRYQPGCPEVVSLKPTDGILCNHGRAIELFAESVRNPEAFRSNKCVSFKDALNSRCLEDAGVYLGQVETYGVGLYYFKTRGSSPYSMQVD